MWTRTVERFGVDLRMVQLPGHDTGVNIFEKRLCAFKIVGSKRTCPSRTAFTDLVDFPIKPTLEAGCYPWPRPDPPEYNDKLAERARYLYENTDYALVGSAIIGGGIFEQPARTMGLENFLMVLVTEPAYADRMMGQNHRHLHRVV
jgi:hypothetical protein